MQNDLFIPPLAFFFRVSVDDEEKNDASFKEISGIEVEMDIEEIQEGGLNGYKHRLPGRTRYRNLVLKRGLVKQDTTFYNWIKEALSAENRLDEPIEVRKLSVDLLDPRARDSENLEPLMSWVFVNAYPVKWSISGFNSQENGLVIETLEFAYQTMRTT